MTAPRIVAGRYRGRRIAVPADGAVRPTASRMREALFSRLSNDLVGARFLDLFAGSGAIGLEALSRGASSVLFVEKDHEAVRSISENLRTFGTGDEARVIRGDARSSLPNRPPAFDIVFADPPYGSALADAVLPELVRRQLLHEKTIIVLELAAREPFTPPVGFEAVDERRYGAGRLVTLRWTAPET
ncbi:MAG: 16S rRNA (guanine(966)-N(2))-methyltransferase RsmD [Geminicoccaceae bacterium]